MVPEKLSIFRKLLAKIGKIYYWKRPKKVNLWLLSSMAFGVTKKYEEIFDGDTGKAIDMFTEHFINGAKVIMYEMQDRMKILFSRSLKDLEFVSEIALYVILGPEWKTLFDRPIFIPAEGTEENIAQLRIKYPVCALCTGLQPGIDLDLSKWKKHSYGELLATALGSLLQMVQDYVENDYNIEVKETKCLLKGDSYGYAIMYFHPKTETE